MLHVKHTPVCSKCHEAPPAPGHRYCRPCKAIYMRGWRKTKVTVDREAAEKAGLTEKSKFAGRTPIDKLPPLGG